MVGKGEPTAAATVTAGNEEEEEEDEGVVVVVFPFETKDFLFQESNKTSDIHSLHASHLTSNEH